MLALTPTPERTRRSRVDSYAESPRCASRRCCHCFAANPSAPAPDVQVDEPLELSRGRASDVRRIAVNLCTCHVQRNVPAAWQRRIEMTDDRIADVRLDVPDDMTAGSPRSLRLRFGPMSTGVPTILDRPQSPSVDAVAAPSFSRSCRSNSRKSYPE